MTGSVLAAAGDLVRIPRDRSIGLVFYRLACPGCGWVTMVRPAAGGIVELGEVVTFSAAVACASCHRGIEVRDIRIEETGRVHGCCRKY